MAGSSTGPHMLGLGQTTYSLGLIKGGAKIPCVTQKKKKRQKSSLLGRFWNEAPLSCGLSQRVSITPRVLFQGSLSSEVAGGYQRLIGIGVTQTWLASPQLVTSGPSFSFWVTRLLSPASSVLRLLWPDACQEHTEGQTLHKC